MLRKYAAAILCCIILAGCSGENLVVNNVVPPATQQNIENTGILNVAVIYDDETKLDQWEETVYMLRQSISANLTAEAINIGKDVPLDIYDIILPDPSLLENTNIAQIAEQLMNYTENGGCLILRNSFCEMFPLDFLGASELKKISCCPVSMYYPQVDSELTRIQEVVRDFAGLYPSYMDYELLSKYDYGYGIVPNTAEPLAEFEDCAVYAVNHYGKGRVFITNPLLPNYYSLGTYSMERTGEGQAPFSNTTASCNQLLLSRVAEYVSLQKNGFAVNRVFGSFGSPSMAWELHYEDISGMENHSLSKMSKLCIENDQIPSFSLVRSTYWWFLRTETITYRLNEGSTANAEFSVDLDESAYSTGTHIDSGGEWLHQESINKAGSYFIDYPQYNYRAYPCFCDLNGDGITDIISGSIDGTFYFYAGKGFDTRLHVETARKLTDTEGNELKVEGFSAPQFIDIDGDGTPDLVSGSSDGKLYWFKGKPEGVFAPRGVMLDTDMPKTQTLPAFGDIDKDGIPDMALGSNCGALVLYYGRRKDGQLVYSADLMEGYSRLCAEEVAGEWLAPCFVDWNGDGNLDMGVGTFDGYIAKLYGNGKGGFTGGGYLTTDEKNYKGNNNLKIGNYCVPAFYDLNGDGLLDLVCGSLEYGLAYPIDSPYFPFHEQLQQEIDYAKENHIYVGLHDYTNAFASEAREQYELKRQLDSFRFYGLQTEKLGVNQHTWFLSSLSDTQSFRAFYTAGLKWHSGFSSPGGGRIAPQNAAENVIALPFFLMLDNDKTLLIQNNSVLPYCNAEWTDISAKYGMPICIYYHCDFVYESETEARSYIAKAADFQKKHRYNFVKEDQMMRLSAAAYNFSVTAGREGDRLTLTPNETASDSPLYDFASQQSVGVEILLKNGTQNISVDADVWYKKDGRLYAGLNRPITITEGTSNDATHLTKVNTAAKIVPNENGAVIIFSEPGMMQAAVSGEASAKSNGWKCETVGTETVFTKFGNAETLEIDFRKGADVQ